MQGQLRKKVHEEEFKLENFTDFFFKYKKGKVVYDNKE